MTWVTLRDASNATGVSISTLRKWRKRGELESRMAPGPTGERIEVPMAAVLDLAAERGAGTVPPAAPVAAWSPRRSRNPSRRRLRSRSRRRGRWNCSPGTTPAPKC